MTGEIGDKLIRAVEYHRGEIQAQREALECLEAAWSDWDIEALKTMGALTEQDIIHLLQDAAKEQGECSDCGYFNMVRDPMFGNWKQCDLNQQRCVAFDDCNREITGTITLDEARNADL